MKYNVNLSYHGSVTLEVDADNGEKALELARDKIGAMSQDEFLEAIELMEDDHDVEELSNTPSWAPPRFTANDVLKGAHCEEDPCLKDINDSMELDSDPVDLVYLKNTILTRSGKRLTVDASVRVVGDVKVEFKGYIYRNASRMPKELVQCYHDGIDPVTIDPDYDVINNNWFEEFIKITDEEGRTIYDYSDVVDSPGDITCLADSVVTVLNDEEICLGMLFKEDDRVRWNDPDKSLVDQMTPVELIAYRAREFCLYDKEDERCSIEDGVSTVEVPYSELLLEEA